MPLLAAVNVHVAFGTRVILDSVSLSIEKGERIGVVGRNGEGKSTLIKALARVLTPDAGAIQIARSARVGYLEQEPAFPAGDTLREAAESAFANLHDLHQQLRVVFDAMAQPDADLDALLRKQATLERDIDAAGGYAVDHTIDTTLHGLGFTDAEFNLPCEALSGGQRARLALAKLLLEGPDAILLDEPTNHLDIAGREWLETFLAQEFSGAVVIVSHDRRLLDTVVTRIVEVEQGRLIDYPSNYGQFRKLRAERRLAQRRAWEKQQTRFKAEERFIARYKAGQRAKQARGRESKLDRDRASSTLERPIELDVFKFDLPKAPRTGEIVVAARDLAMIHPRIDPATGEKAGERTLFSGLDITISSGERWAIVGPNGAGKTTLARILTEDLAPTKGLVRPGSNLRVGYFTQTPEGVDPDLPLVRYLQRMIAKENPDAPLSEQRARDLAGAFLFSGVEQDKPLGALSGGEMGRVRLAGLLASAKNVLVLDEPTNHLDIPSAERLEQALSPNGGYTGALILISHDRALIDATCDHLVVLDGEGKTEVYPGSYAAWRDHKRERARAVSDSRATRTNRAPSPKKSRPRARPNSEANQRLSDDATDDTSSLSLNQIEARIESLESQLRGIDANLAKKSTWTDAAAMQRLSQERSEVAAQLEPLEMEWARRATLE